MPSIFGNDPVWLVIVKVVVVFALLLTWTIFNVWFERRVLGKMQNRLGPVMNGPLGLGQALGDGVKLIMKEDFRPARTDRVVFNLAPLLITVAAFTTWTVIPLGGEVSIFGVTTRLQVTDLPVAVLFVIAIASIGIYGIVLAGWSSNGTYSLLGSMRATAQLISYEIAMGLSLVAVFMFAGSMSTSQIVAAQSSIMSFSWLNVTMPSWLSLPGWYGLLLLPSFVTYVISMFGECNRLPFDLSECESELVSGHITDYSGFRYAMFFLSEYINMATTSAVATTLFLGGYRAPWPLNTLWNGFFDTGWWGPVWFILKVQCLIFVFAWARAALPRMRYDQFMSLGWKILIPFNLVWIFLLAVFRGVLSQGEVPLPVMLVSLAVIIVVVFAVVWLMDRRNEPPKLAPNPDEFDAFAGGYPVPPMPGQQLPELVGLVPAALRVPGGEEEAAPSRRAVEGDGL